MENKYAENVMAHRIDKIVSKLTGDECQLCGGKCHAYSWSISYWPPIGNDEPGSWNFSLYLHTKEIWYIREYGGIYDILLTALEGLIKEKYNKNKKEE